MSTGPVAENEPRHGLPESPRTTRILLLCGAVAPVIFAVVYLVDGALRPGYSSWHHTISTLSLGGAGWIQIANFMISGLLTVCFAAGLRRTLRPGPGSVVGPLLFSIVGFGLIVIGPFVTDPVLGYPSAAPAVPSLHGGIHNLASLLVFVALPVACLALGRRSVGAPSRGWAPYSIVTGILAFAFFGLFFAGVSAAHGQDGGTSPAGLFQRIPILILGVWQTLLGLRLLSTNAPGSASATG